jgi:hypothetical protein
MISFKGWKGDSIPFYWGEKPGVKSILCKNINFFCKNSISEVIVLSFFP